jgi:hypothetical protein
MPAFRIFILVIYCMQTLPDENVLSLKKELKTRSINLFAESYKQLNYKRYIANVRIEPIFVFVFKTNTARAKANKSKRHSVIFVKQTNRRRKKIKFIRLFANSFKIKTGVMRNPNNFQKVMHLK